MSSAPWDEGSVVPLGSGQNPVHFPVQYVVSDHQVDVVAQQRNGKGEWKVIWTDTCLRGVDGADWRSNRVISV